MDYSSCQIAETGLAADSRTSLPVKFFTANKQATAWSCCQHSLESDLIF